MRYPRTGAPVEALAGGEPAVEAEATTREEESTLARRRLGDYL